MRTSEWSRFRCYSGTRKTNRGAVSARRSYWRCRLREEGVPADILEESVDALLRYRRHREWYRLNAEKARRWSREWAARHRRKVRNASNRWYRSKKADDRTRVALALGATPCQRKM